MKFNNEYINQIKITAKNSIPIHRYWEFELKWYFMRLRAIWWKNIVHKNYGNTSLSLNRDKSHTNHKQEKYSKRVLLMFHSISSCSLALTLKSATRVTNRTFTRVLWVTVWIRWRIATNKNNPSMWCIILSCWFLVFLHFSSSSRFSFTVYKTTPYTIHREEVGKYFRFYLFCYFGVYTMEVRWGRFRKFHFDFIVVLIFLEFSMCFLQIRAL